VPFNIDQQFSLFVFLVLLTSHEQNELGFALVPFSADCASLLLSRNLTHHRKTEPNSTTIGFQHQHITKREGGNKESKNKEK
jgi:hypothetical protein